MIIFFSFTTAEDRFGNLNSSSQTRLLSDYQYQNQGGSNSNIQIGGAKQSPHVFLLGAIFKLI